MSSTESEMYMTKTECNIFYCGPVDEAIRYRNYQTIRYAAKTIKINKSPS